jgi:hypothetical protein
LPVTNLLPAGRPEIKREAIEGSLASVQKAALLPAIEI